MTRRLRPLSLTGAVGLAAATICLFRIIVPGAAWLTGLLAAQL